VPSICCCAITAWWNSSTGPPPRGWVERSRDAEDGRLTRVALTPDGEARLSRLGPAHLDELRNLVPVLDQLVSDWAAHTEKEPAEESG